MSLLDIQTLLTPLTGDQVRANFVTTLQSLGIPAGKWTQGGVASTLLTVVSQQFASFQNLIVQAIAASFLDTATGGWLTLLAANVYGVTRIAATFATGPLTLTNTGGGIYTFAAGAATFANPTTKVTYTNDVGFTLGAFATLTFNITATIQGTQGNAAPGTVTQLITTMLGVTATNPTAVAGLDAETDAALVLQCKAKLGSLSVRGVRTAYVFAVTSAVNPGTDLPVNINRVAVSASSSTGTVTVVMASPSGAPSTGDFNAAIANIEAVARPEAVTVNPVAASLVPYPNTLTVWVRQTPGLDLASVATQVENALTLFFSTYPIGGLATDTFTGLFAADINGVCVGANPLIFAVDGATDLPLLFGQIAVDETTVNVRFHNVLA